jgi:DNA-binding NtrC family response regulator
MATDPEVGHALSVLVVDDSVEFAAMLVEWLASSGHRAEAVTAAEQGLSRVQEESFDVLVVDLGLPGMDGLSFLRHLALENRPEVVILSGGITVRSAVDAMKLGAYDCLPKTESMEAVELVVRKAGESRRRNHKLHVLSRRIEHRSPSREFITVSPRLHEVLKVLEDVAASNVSVLLTGESGTGKDLLARQVHRLSARASGPFVDVNCAALSATLLEAELFGHEKGAFTGATSTRPGLVEVADGGTLFLDEVVEMPPSLQAKLLRMTEDRTLYRVGGRQRIHVDIRIVAATNRDLSTEIANGRVREDLYYRLAGVEIRVPPLRDRPEDIEPLARHYLTVASRQAGRGPGVIAPAALEVLVRYRWPGNVRELRNLMERCAWTVHAPVLEIQHLPPDMAQGGRSDAPAAGERSLKEVERERIQQVLDEERWHHGRAASRLGLPVRTLYRKIKAYRLMRPGHADARA